jgi:hypothetical protein
MHWTSGWFTWRLRTLTCGLSEGLCHFVNHPPDGRPQAVSFGRSSSIMYRGNRCGTAERTPISGRTREVPQ